MPVGLIGLMVAQLAAGWPWIGDAQPHSYALPRGAPLEITGRLHGQPARVQLTSAIVNDCSSATWLYGAVPDRAGRCTRLADVNITVAGRVLHVSDGYGDLGGVKDVVVRFSPSKIVIYIRGPDGPEYYGATLEFDQRDIVRRRLDLADGGTAITNYTSTKLEP